MRRVRATFASRLGSQSDKGLIEFSLSFGLLQFYLRLVSAPRLAVKVSLLSLSTFIFYVILIY